MRGVFAALFLCAVAQPCLAQTFLKSEPYYLAPFAVVYVVPNVHAHLSAFS